MEHKYVLKKKTDQFIIQEMSETEPGKFAMLFEEKISLEKVVGTIPQGKAQLIEMFRSHNFYPPSLFADMLAIGISNMFQDPDNDSMTLTFNDNDALHNRETSLIELLVDESELAEIDKLLEDEDDVGDEFEE